MQFVAELVFVTVLYVKFVLSTGNVLGSSSFKQSTSL